MITFSHWYQGVQIVFLNNKKIGYLSQEIPNWFTFRYNGNKWNINHPYKVVECLKELPEFISEDLRV